MSATYGGKTLDELSANLIWGTEESNQVLFDAMPDLIKAAAERDAIQDDGSEPKTLGAALAHLKGARSALNRVMSEFHELNFDGNQERVVTVWKNGEWKSWGAVDAFYAQADPDYLVTIPVKELTKPVEASQEADGPK